MPTPLSSRRWIPFVAALLGAACSSTTEPVEDAVVGVALQARQGGGVFLITQVQDLNAYPEALFEGRVVADAAGCVRLEGSASTVLWPRGWTARAEGGGTVLVDEKGDAVGALGDTFRMGGGHMPSLHEGLGFSPEDQALAAPCPGDFWLATPGTVERR